MKKKININFIIIALIAILATTFGITFACYGLFQKQAQSDLKIDAELLKNTDVFKDTSSDISSLFDDLEIEDIRITWIDMDGTVLFDNDVNVDDLGNHLNRPEIKEAIENGCGQIVRKSDTFNMNTIYYALRLDNGTIIRVSREVQSIMSVFMTILPLILLLILFISGICILISHLLTKQLIEPINTMAEQLDSSIEEPTYKELIPFSDKIRSQHENILLAAKSRQDFTANVSHELKTPLTAISGYAELIENKMVDNEQIPYIAQQIHNNANQLLALINDIINLSELDHKELKRDFVELDLFDLVKEECKTLKVSAYQKNISLYCRGENVMVYGDKDLLKEVVDNIVQNSIQYTNENGKIDVFVKKENQTPVLIVKDNGIGIPKEAQDRVFERFYRVDKSHSRQTGGTGLGLAIVKHIVEIHDAKIELKSEINKGTEIKIIF